MIRPDDARVYIVAILLYVVGVFTGMSAISRRPHVEASEPSLAERVQALEQTVEIFSTQYQDYETSSTLPWYVEMKRRIQTLEDKH